MDVGDLAEGRSGGKAAVKAGGNGVQGRASERRAPGRVRAAESRGFTAPLQGRESGKLLCYLRFP